MDYTAIVALVVGLASGLLPTIVKFVNELRKGKDESNTTNNGQVIANNEQAMRFYKELLENLQKELKEIKLNQDELEKLHLAARESNAELRSENKFLKEKYEALKHHDSCS